MIHRVHDYRDLIRRWRSVAKLAGIRLTPFSSASGFDVFCVRTPALSSGNGVYISAGIHGDEAGATEGLITWAERNARKLAGLPLLIFPCLNPWGLRNNVRTNESGDESQQVRDANYQGNLPRLRAIKKKYDPANLFRLNANVQPA